MKVILLQDVAKIGRRFEVVNVPDGYALNKLIPTKQAEPATAENLKRVQARATKIETDRAGQDASFDAALEVLKDATVTVEAPANEQGHLFKAVSADEVVAAAALVGATIAANQIVVKTPIKEVGEHSVALVSGVKQGMITVTVVAK